MYNLLLQDDESQFEGWKIEPGYVHTNVFFRIHWEQSKCQMNESVLIFVYIPSLSIICMCYIVSPSKIPTTKVWSVFWFTQHIRGQCWLWKYVTPIHHIQVVDSVETLPTVLFLQMRHTGFIALEMKNSAKRRGKFEGKSKVKRRYERLNRVNFAWLGSCWPCALPVYESTT